MKRTLKLLVIPVVVGLLMLATAVPAFAGAPDGGLGTALTAAGNSFDKGANDAPAGVPEGAPGYGTHTAVGRIVCLNPAQELLDCPQP